MKTAHLLISRELAAQFGREAVQVIEAGHYRAPSGRTVALGDLIESSVEGTVSYPPELSLPERRVGGFQTRISVENGTTLSAAKQLLDSGHHPAALNFASATHPGGGFLNGARAQEEYLARSSGLYACLRHNPMYAYNRELRDPLYTNYVIYSPDVPVFRADDGSLLEEPYTVSIITSPAVNASALPSVRHKEIPGAMWERILKVLSAGSVHGHDSIVLGAWGCGAFGNDGWAIARLFQKALSENFEGAYGRIVFAITDWSAEKRFIRPFGHVFQVREVGQ